MGNNVSSSSSNLDHGTYSPHSADKIHKYNTTPRRSTTTAKAYSDHQTSRPTDQPTESSRLFFLLYLLHRTWNVVKDKGKGYVNSFNIWLIEKWANSFLLSGNGSRMRTLRAVEVSSTMILIWTSATSTKTARPTAWMTPFVLAAVAVAVTVHLVTVLRQSIITRTLDPGGTKPKRTRSEF